jgi:hypothetical protein
MKNFANRSSRIGTTSWMATLALLMGTVACGTMEDGSAPVEGLRTQQQAVETVNGLTLNGLTLNGLTLNGLTLNGLTLNGLTLNGLTVNGLESEDFSSWFARDAAVNARIMAYVVRCAVPAGEQRGYQDPSTGTSYTWDGVLGVAPAWASGQPMTEAEQQVVSACIAAHINKYGMHVALSVLGRTAQSEPIPYTSEELQSFPRREGCFFGNLFTQEGLFVGMDGASLMDEESSPRACALTTSQDSLSSQCSPIVRVESCESLCTLDPSGLFYTQCTYNGRTYQPLTTRIRSEDVYTCGDGVCQFTESCGTGTQANSCLSDCGPCL